MALLHLVAAGGRLCLYAALALNSISWRQLPLLTAIYHGGSSGARSPASVTCVGKCGLSSTCHTPLRPAARACKAAGLCCLSLALHHGSGHAFQVIDKATAVHDILWPTMGVRPAYMHVCIDGLSYEQWLTLWGPSSLCRWGPGALGCLDAMSGGLLGPSITDTYLLHICSSQYRACAAFCCTMGSGFSIACTCYVAFLLFLAICMCLLAFFMFMLIHACSHGWVGGWVRSW
jgi:hypothetical protein